MIKISKNYVLQNEGHQLLTLLKSTKASDEDSSKCLKYTDMAPDATEFLPQNTEDATSLMRLLQNIFKKPGKAAWLRYYGIHWHGWKIFLEKRN